MIDLATLTRPELIAAREESARNGAACESAAVLAKGRRKSQLRQWARDHWRNATECDRLLAGDDRGAADMSADELLAALLA